MAITVKELGGRQILFCFLFWFWVWGFLVLLVLFCFLQCGQILEAFVRAGPFQEKQFASKIIKYRFKQQFINEKYVPSRTQK